jgi:hypothetical protein
VGGEGEGEDEEKTYTVDSSTVIEGEGISWENVFTRNWKAAKQQEHAKEQGDSQLTATTTIVADSQLTAATTAIGDSQSTMKAYSTEPTSQSSEMIPAYDENLSAEELSELE